MNTWMVRSGRGSAFFEQFKELKNVGLGWRKIGNLAAISSREELARNLSAQYPEYPAQTVAMNTGQLFRFAKEIQLRDRVVTYDSESRIYLCGTIRGGYEHFPDESEEILVNRRDVDWQFEVYRDHLSQAARNSLGSIATLFQISEAVSGELWSKPTSPPMPDVLPTVPESAIETADSLLGKGKILIQDRAATLDWEEMQSLVAGLLRGMGYKTTISPKGPDRGKDILASPDRFGFEEPRIVVEVKHRPGQKMGSKEITSFLGGRHSADKGLYVSTGGFSQEARYEAERAKIPLTLMDLEMLVDALLEHYPQFDEETKRLLPIKQLYWPI